MRRELGSELLALHIGIRAVIDNLACVVILLQKYSA